MKVFTSESQKIGKIGEDAVAKFLVKQGFEIVEQNYTKRFGEIDVVASKEANGLKKLYFIEVKSISCDLFSGKPPEGKGYYRPEENMHANKIRRLKTTISSYLMSFRNNDKGHIESFNRHEEGDDLEPTWQFDLFVVYIDAAIKKIVLKRFENIIL